ncbi:MAG: BON domain-containing protein, partial [Burkholderiales bacterium]
MHILKKTARMSLWFVMAVLIASCATRPPRTATELESDQQLEDAVTKQLARDPNLYARHIDVNAYRGVVTLSGFVFETTEPFEAAQVAARVPGVVS